MIRSYFLIFISFILLGCLPEAPQTVPRTDGQELNNQTEDDSDSNETPTEEIVESVKWFNSGLELETLTIDFDNNKNLYLRGDDVNNFLNNSAQFQSSYCIVVNYPSTSSTTPKPLYAKVIPFIDQTFVGQFKRSFRVNLVSSSGNNSCLLPTGFVDSSDNLQTVPAPASAAFHSSDVCLGCKDIITSNSLVLYQVKEFNGTTYLEAISQSSISYNKLNLRIDINSNSGDGSSSCTTSQCQAQGFDCCVQGQCVNEKGIKSAGVEADPSGFEEAESEKEDNENWYKKYPQFYHICLEQTPTDGEQPPVEPEDPQGDADARLESLINDYYCIEELKEKSLADPFHTDPIDESQVYTKCEKTDSSNNLYFETVMRRLYTNCRCAVKDDFDQMVKDCPKYTYTPVYVQDNEGKDTEEIESIECVAPPVENTPTPFQDLEVVVSSKRAPQRFFNENGVELNPDEVLPEGVSGEQEGTKFQYLDDEKLFPQNGTFNMNSIIGQITLGPEEAIGAKLVNVEFDKMYLISTIDGFYSPCSLCAKDSWFNNFSAQPSTQQGVGLQAIGYSTRRDTFDGNTTFGNYEDTIFGRACWVPPTMIPFSHEGDTDVQTQRLNRQQVQAAFFANGYQRDWYGFNKGAIIGSFDGVSWFAIGKNRVVRATTDRLYIAVNAPFADLANATEHQVSVQEYDFVSTAPSYDYDPNEAINSAFQNEAGLCQKYHECDTDAQCITKLGWEYTCADVSFIKTKWPSFDPNGAKEVLGQARIGQLIEFLNQGELPPDSGTKRCVYRGAGAPCRVDYQNISDEGLRKNLTCAPNYYCADLDKTGVFNKEVARFARPIDEQVDSKNHLYGQDANILGRPKDYTAHNGLESLTDPIKTAVTRNLNTMDSSTVTQFGICKPGKKLPSYANSISTLDWEPEVQHASEDEFYRTDFISQIASCNSALYTDLRYSSCPILDESGNYIHTQTSFIEDSFFIPALDDNFSKQFTVERYSFAQNACGLESLDENTDIGPGIRSDDIRDFSAFKTIEARTLATSDSQVQPTLVQDACFRRAGAVCHTDLDCSPNRLMAETIDLRPDSFFGNLAEKTYFEEFLVCGQAETKPNLNDANFNTFNIENNRCCRPVGESITMHTEDSPNAPESQGLRTDLIGSLNPSDSRRYSRYSITNSLINSASKTIGIVRPSANADDVNNDKILDNTTVNITKRNQWKTLHETAARTCCGSNWVRKFADGTNDWTVNRLNLDVADFKCLNSKSPLYLTENASAFNLDNSFLSRDRIDFCIDPGLETAGCIQSPFGEISDFLVRRPVIDTTTVPMTLDSNPEKMEGLWADNPWTFSFLRSADQVDLPYLDWSSSEEDATRKNIITRLPSFIAFEDVGSLNVSLPNPFVAGSNAQCRRLKPQSESCSVTGGNFGLCGPTDPWVTAQNDQGVNETCDAGIDVCCYVYNESTRVLRVAYTNDVQTDSNNFEKVDISLNFSFTAPGTLLWEQEKTAGASVDDASLLDHRRSSEPGNALYYLRKLAKLEYLGIPQMTYEPIYCNDNYQKMVPGIFKDTAFGSKLKTVMDFINHPRTFEDPDVNGPWSADSAGGDQDADELNRNLVGTQELIDQAQIFSDNQFMCCRELGAFVKDANQCCSGYAVAGTEVGEDSDDLTQDEDTLTCRLPAGTNLNVYFNKFVSGEGLAENNSGVVLTNDDFDQRTGEPVLSTTVNTKLQRLGETFCEFGQVRRGGAFGPFQAEPFGSEGQQDGGGQVFSILDSVFDNSSITNQQVGFTVFNLGFRWNHQFYCEIGDAN